MSVADNEQLQQQVDTIELYQVYARPTWFYFTSYYRSVNLGGRDYGALPSQRDAVTYSVDLGDIVTKLTVPASSSVGQALIGVPSGIASIGIYKYLLSQIGNSEPPPYDTVFAGYVKSASVSKGEVSLSLSSWLDDMGRETPRKRFQSTCNNTLFDAYTVGGVNLGCRAVAGDWQELGVVSGISGNTITMQRLYLGNNMTGGKICKQGGTNYRNVLSWEPLDAEHVQVTIDGDAGLQIGDSVHLWPGCNKTFGFGSEQGLPCPNNCTTFRNTARYLGAERMPYKNASLTPSGQL